MAPHLVVPLQLVKAALALALLGGRQKHMGKNSVPVRGDAHILIVGDPGLGKSQMLQVTQQRNGFLPSESDMLFS